MSVDNRDIPLAHDRGSLRPFPQDKATNNMLYYFEQKKKPYVMKELRPDSKYYRIEKEPEILAKWMNKTFAIISKYFSDDSTAILRTHYFVAKSEYRQPTVVTLQEVLYGPTLRQLDRGHREDPQKILHSFENKWERAKLDFGWQEFPRNISNFFQEMDINLDHIIYDRDKYYLVDW